MDEKNVPNHDYTDLKSFQFLRTKKGIYIAVYILIGSFLLLFPWPWKYDPQLVWGWLPSSVLWWFSYYIIALIIFIFIARDWYKGVKGKYEKMLREEETS